MIVERLERPESKRHGHKHVIVYFCLLSCIACFWQLRENFVPVSYDMDFHLSRFYGFSNVLQSPINFLTFGSLGQPINLFYGWLTTYPIYFFAVLFGDMIRSVNLYVYFFTLATFLIAYFSMYKIEEKKFISFIFSLLYTLSMYRFVCLFYRGALAEAIGLTFYPLLFLAVYQIMIQKKDSWLLLAISFSLLLYSHVLSALMAFVFLLFFYFSFLVSWYQHKKEATITLFKAGISALIFSLPFLVPLIEQSAYQKINPPGKSILEDRALPVVDLLQGAIKQDLKSYSFGAVLLILMVFSIFSFFNFSNLQKYLLIVGVATLFCLTDWFPWSIFQETVVRMIQFPWRLMGIVTLLFCFISSYFIDFLIESRKGQFAFALFLSILLICLNMSSVQNLFSNMEQSQIKTEDFPSILERAHTFDYRPLDYEQYSNQIDNRLVTVNGQEVKYKKDIQASKYSVEVEANENEEIVLPVYKYKGLHVLLNGEKIETIDSSSLVSINAQQGVNRIELTYSYTLLAKLSFMVSLVFFVYVISKIE